MYIINKLDEKQVITIGTHDKSIWDAKGLAVRYIRHFITENDGAKSLDTAYNFDIASIKADETVKRHFFVLNEENGTFDVYKVIANPEYSYIWGYTNTPKVELIFSLSITKLDKNELFKSEIIAFKESDLTTANNTNVDKEEKLAHASLVSELKYFINANIAKIEANVNVSEEDEHSD